MLPNPALLKQTPFNLSPEDCFDRLFDKYSPCIYGILLQLADTQPAGAAGLLREIYVEIFSQHCNNNQAEKNSFTSIVAILINVTVRNGYSKEEVMLLLRKPTKPPGLLDGCFISLTD